MVYKAVSKTDISCSVFQDPVHWLPRQETCPKCTVLRLSFGQHFCM